MAIKKLDYQLLLLGSLASILVYGFTGVAMLVILLSLIILNVLIIHRGAALIIFDAFTLFSIYYLTISFAIAYLHLTDFEGAIFLHSSLYNERDVYLNISGAYAIVGILSSYAGYKLVLGKKTLSNFNLNLNIRGGYKLLSPIIYLFFILGFINFGYNVWSIAGGDVILYFQGVAQIKEEFDEFGGTTIGYRFSEMAVYLWFAKCLNRNRFSFAFFTAFLLALLMMASNGRIFSTIIFAMTFVCIKYLHDVESSYKKNYKYVLLFLVAAIVGVIFYLYRIASSLIFNNISSSFLESLYEMIDIKTILGFAVDGGNVPNIPIFMKILQSWGDDFGYLYGQSLISWVYAILPSSMRPVDYQISAIVKNEWFHDIVGGSLPPTGLGEMYVNFGVAGPFFGMFLFGGLAGLLVHMLIKYNNIWFVIFYANVLIGFIFIYPKAEFDNFSVWYFIPLMLTYFSYKFLYLLLNKKYVNEFE